MEKTVQTENMQKGQAVATLKDVSFSSPDKLLFYGVDLVVKKGQNTTLIGESGVGKSTLLKLVLGRIVPDTGTVVLSKKLKVSYVPQDIEELDIEATISIRDLFFKARGLDMLGKRKAELEQEMTKTDPEKLQAILNEYGTISEEYEKRGGYAAESDMGKILAGLKLDQNSTGHITPDSKLNEVSSGQKTRVLIGQALFANSDLLVLDDPTSHLDVESVDWLSKYLRNSEQATLIATNNLPFINACANKVVEITDFGRVLAFEGDYGDYLTKRDRLLEAEKAEAEAVMAEKDRIEATYKDFKAKQVFKRSSAMAQVGRSLQTRIQRLEDEHQELPGSKQVHRSERVRNIAFEAGRRSGDNVVTIGNVMKEYGNYLALDLSLLDTVIKRGGFFLVSGGNGSGKSTLLRLIASAAGNQEFDPTIGSIEIGASVNAAYYSQDYTGIAREGDIFEEVRTVVKGGGESEAAAILHFWGFPKATIRNRQIDQLSVGEKKQLALAKIMAQHPNLLLLDEPTDYLKPEIVDRLVSALLEYNGTVILVSHNSEFKKSLKFHRELELPQGKIKLLNESK